MEEAAARAYMRAGGYQVLEGSIPEHPTYREAQNRGAAISETKNAKLNERADALMEALLRQVTQNIKARAASTATKRKRAS
jgi:chromosome partitioning protein